ncbi:hypothetical protein ACO2FA_13370 [Staphylococcus warneri]
MNHENDGQNKDVSVENKVEKGKRYRIRYLILIFLHSNVSL